MIFGRFPRSDRLLVMNASCNTRASYSGYIALCSVWLALSLGNIGLWISKGRQDDCLQVAALCGLVGALFAIWLSEFTKSGFLTWCKVRLFDMNLDSKGLPVTWCKVRLFDMNLDSKGLPEREGIFRGPGWGVLD